MKTDLLVL